MTFVLPVRGGVCLAASLSDAGPCLVESRNTPLARGRATCLPFPRHEVFEPLMELRAISEAGAVLFRFALRGSGIGVLFGCFGREIDGPGLPGGLII